MEMRITEHTRQINTLTVTMESMRISKDSEYMSLTNSMEEMRRKMQSMIDILTIKITTLEELILTLRATIMSL